MSSLYAMNEVHKTPLSLRPLIELSEPDGNLFPRLSSQLKYRETVLKRACPKSFVAKRIGSDLSKFAIFACELNVSIDELWYGLIGLNATTNSLEKQR